MGNLHAGHISLMEQARAHGDTVVASILSIDCKSAERETRHLPAHFPGRLRQADQRWRRCLFAPSEQDLYPEPQEYFVEPPAIQNVLDGEFRPGHFRGRCHSGQQAVQLCATASLPCSAKRITSS